MTMVAASVTFVNFSILQGSAVAAITKEECRVDEYGETVCEDDYDEDEYDDEEYDDEEDDDLYDYGGYGGDEGGECKDSHESCMYWASVGECDANPRWMHPNCKEACGKCTDAKIGHRPPHSADKDRMLQMIAQYGEPQRIEGSEASSTLAVVRQTNSYMKNFVGAPNPTHNMTAHVMKECRNRHELCSFWVAIGECEANPAFMVTNCAPSCRSCHKIDFQTRCPPRDPSAKPALQPGDLNLMFERILQGASDSTDAFRNDGITPSYTVTVHSRPTSSAQSLGVHETTDHQEPPWVITFDNFLTNEECDHMIRLGHKHKYQRSKDVGEQKFDGSFDGHESTSRTSENAWCSDREGCRNDLVASRLHNRMSQVTGIPAQNSEDMQLLKYEVGQFYRIHHDFIPHQRDRQCGPRILTFFLYLSDVEEGGGTAFQNLGNLTIIPKKGRALLWPSVLNSDPSKIDKRMRHEALPVWKGTKFAANAWVHLYDYLTPQRAGCN